MAWILLVGLLWGLVAIVDAIKKKGVEEEKYKEWEWKQQQERIQKIKEQNQFDQAADEMFTYAQSPNVLPSELPKSVDEFVLWKRNHPGKSIEDYCNANAEKIKNKAFKELVEYSKSPDAIREALPDNSNEYVNWRLLHKDGVIHEYIFTRLQSLGYLEMSDVHKDTTNAEEFKKKALKELVEYSKSPDAIREALPENSYEYVNWRLLHKDGVIHEYIFTRLQSLGYLETSDVQRETINQMGK